MIAVDLQERLRAAGAVEKVASVMKRDEGVVGAVDDHDGALEPGDFVGGVEA